MKCFFKGFVITLLLIISVQSVHASPQMAIIRNRYLKSGNFNFLKNQTKIRVEYDWDSVSVAKYNRKGDIVQTEEEYIKENVQKKNNKKLGSGNLWLEKWKSIRKSRYEPAFELALNDMAEKHLPTTFSSSYHETQYTLILKTTYIEVEKYGYIYVTCTFVESGDHSKILAEFVIERLYDDMPAKTNQIRLESGYYDTGNVLIREIIEFNKKALKSKK